MTVISRANGWHVDTATQTLSWPDVAESAPLPETTLASLIYFGLGYLESQAGSRTVSDSFRRAWAEANNAKASEAPKSVVPSPDSLEYREALREAHKALYATLVAGYEVGVRDSGSSPLDDEIEKLSREVLFRFAQAKGWYALPARKRSPSDTDAYADPAGRYATFGEALAAFKASTADSTYFNLKVNGTPLLRVRKGASITNVIAAEATKRVEARSAGATLVESPYESEAPLF